MNSDRKPDAIRAPLSVANADNPVERTHQLQAHFAPVLGVEVVHIRHQGADYFITGDAADRLQFPVGDPREGQPRYEWKDAGDGVKHGFLRS
jgi:hypothetical protein